MIVVSLFLRRSIASSNFDWDGKEEEDKNGTKLTFSSNDYCRYR